MTVRRVYRRILLSKSREVKVLSVLKRLTAGVYWAAAARIFRYLLCRSAR